jgi:hypothetical protein
MNITTFLKLFYTLSIVCLVGAPCLINWPLLKFMSDTYSKGEDKAKLTLKLIVHLGSLPCQVNGSETVLS